MGSATSPAALAMELVVDLLAFVTWPVRVRDVKSAPLLSVFQPFDCADSRTAAICSRVTSNCSMTSSMLRSSRFSMTVATGKRVPLNTHAPLTLSGTLSTAGHWDQSGAAMADLQDVIAALVSSSWRW
jgi:hypothetical protein